MAHKSMEFNPMGIALNPGKLFLRVFLNLTALNMFEPTTADFCE